MDGRSYSDKRQIPCHAGRMSPSYKYGYANRTVHAPGYDTFMTAKQRCTNPNSQDYENYGGRGILFLFKNFHELVEEIGLRPSSKHSLDRINNNSHYMVGNVRWATAKEQANNRRNKRLQQFSTQELLDELNRRKQEEI